MVLCIIGLVVFGILGIFSAKYRKLAKEAFECVFRMAQLKPCQGGFDDRIRREILTQAFKVHPTLAKYVNRYFGLLSWIFVASFFISLFFAGQGIYNYAVYGNCNGPQGGFCIFDPFSSTGQHSGDCQVIGTEGKTLNYPANLGPHIIGSADAKVTLVEVGCFSCPFTKQAEPAVKEILKKYEGKIRFAYKPLPLVDHPFANESLMAADCAGEQGKFWEYKDALFANQEAVRNGGANKLVEIAKNLGLNADNFQQCLSSNKYKSDLEQDLSDGIQMGIYGTPTFFVNHRALVGPQTVDQLSQIIDEELSK